MNFQKKYRVLILLFSVLLSGCGKKDTGGEKVNEKSEPSVVDYMTGAEDIRQYKRAREKIEEINKEVQTREKILFGE